MYKDFDTWNSKKKDINSTTEPNLKFRNREIWWCTLGLNIGDEQDGKNHLFERPVLVVKKFNSRLAWVLPMSTKDKIGKYYYSIRHDNRSFSIILSQLRLVSTKRFTRRIRKLRNEQFRLIVTELKSLI